LTNNSKKIKVLIYEPYPMGFGGNFLTQRHILERLDRAQFTPIVMSPVPGVAHDEFRKLAIECVVIPPPGKLGSYGGAILRTGAMGRLKVVIDLLQYNLKLAHYLRVRQIDIVYANCVRAEMSIGLAACLARVPSFLYIKGELANPVIDWLSFVLATKICFQCEQNRDDKYPSLVHFYQRKINILKTGIDPTVLNGIEQRDKTALCEELGLDLGYTNIVVPAQLNPLKGQHLVLEALSRLVKDFPKIRLYLLGDHVIEEYRPYKLELDRIIEKHRLEKHVQFTGWRRDALDIVALMDIVIHPSFSEGFPRAVLEAMSLGKPVIATRVGGLREAIQDNKNGFLVEPGDVDAIERRWRELLANPEMRMRFGQEAKRTIFAEYLIDDKVARLSEIWTEMARDKG
jgi:glycosyltransferase involved in cell wall biosynthesis